MKIRTDFVTNSSSSSFIAVFGTATDNNLAIKSAKDNGLKAHVIFGQDLLNDWNNIIYEHTCDSWCWVDPFPNKSDINEEKIYFVYSSYTGVGTDEDGEILQSELDNHNDDVLDTINGLDGFDFEIQSGSGYNG